MSIENASARPWSIGTGWAGYQTAILDADGRIIADVEVVDPSIDRSRAEDNAQLMVDAVNAMAPGFPRDRAEQSRLLDRALDANLERSVCPGPSAPSYTVRPESHADDMHAIQRDLKR